jgi:hypothetical protein
MTNLANENKVQARGRAALTNPAVRFDRVTTEHADDGWDIPKDIARFAHQNNAGKSAPCDQQKDLA